ncbi:MAG: hypothetical protein HY054_10640 [Proteobacteria bacterium]|nr:hypothetical protein [Pseudomonadota bacterium]
MRIYAIANAMALIAQPAWSHHKLNHRTFFQHAAATNSAPHTSCAVTNNPHQPPGAAAAAQRCLDLLNQLRAAPNDAALRERCDRAARAITGRPCDITTHRY